MGMASEKIYIWLGRRIYFFGCLRGSANDFYLYFYRNFPIFGAFLSKFFNLVQISKMTLAGSNSILADANRSPF